MDGGKPELIVDCTDNTRTGPIPTVEAGKSSKGHNFDGPEVMQPILFYAALTQRTQALQALYQASDNAKFVLDQPPVIFNDPDTLNLRLKSRQAQWRRTLSHNKRGHTVRQNASAGPGVFY